MDHGVLNGFRSNMDAPSGGGVQNPPANFEQVIGNTRGRSASVVFAFELNGDPIRVFEIDFWFVLSDVGGYTELL